MRFLWRRPRTALLVLSVLLALFVLRPGANGLRKRIINSVSLSLGRKVDVQWVKLRVLPAPGFDLVNFVVYDDPEFSAEPMLRAQEVIATLRIRSLLRGRMEIGRLSLKEPSLNLVRGQDGHWNLESLIARTAHTELVPRHAQPEHRARFPYIEADNGRINFKLGLEKKSYSLTDADFALWLESEDQWGMRLSAQPVRTDFNLSDTGTLRVNGKWQRSSILRDTPVKFTFRWDDAQAGELSKLFYGRDFGWRGRLALETDLSGTPASLGIKVKGSVDDFRRYDIVTQQALRLAANCEARYSSIEHAVSDLVCISPVAQGSITLKGRIGAPTGPRTYDLSWALQDVPMQALINLARHAKRDVPDDLAATGTMAGTFSLQSSPAKHSLQWSGNAHTQHFSLQSPGAKIELALGTVPFSVQTIPVHHESDSRTKSEGAVRLAVGPLTMTTGKQFSAVVQGWASTLGYNVAIQGDGAVDRLLQTAQVAGIQVPRMAVDGSLKFNLLVAGAWAAFAAPRPTGTMQLHSVQAQLPGFKGRVNVSSANVSLDTDSVTATHIVAGAAGTSWQGSLSFPRPCHLLSGCPIHFALHADVIAANRFHQWLSPANRRPAWYSFSEASHNASVLSLLNASGTLDVNRVALRTLTADRVTCKIEVHDGLLHVSALNADVFGGKHRGDWTGNLGVSPPEFAGTGKFERVALSEVSTAMHDDWISGTGNGTYGFYGQGKTLQEWFASGKGTLHFDIKDGVLPHIVVEADKGPLQVRRFSGQLSFREGVFALAHGQLDSPGANYEVTGADFSMQKLQIKLANSGGSFIIDGTLSAPHVSPANLADTRAALKP